MQKSDNKYIFLFLLLGFISGIPFLLILSTLSFWLIELGFSKTVIGALVVLSAPYSLKPLLAIVVDGASFKIFNYKFDNKYRLGILANLCLVISVIILGINDPKTHFAITIIAAFVIAFFAAMQDIIIDSLRIETIHDQNLGLGATLESIGFRGGMIMSGAGALYIAHYYSWFTAYWIMALLILSGSFVFYFLERKISNNLIYNPKIDTNDNIFTSKNNFKKIIIEIKREVSSSYFFIIFLCVFFFKIVDSSLNSMAASFIYDLGLSKIDYANISKFLGTGMMILGSITSGIFIQRLGSVISMKLSTLVQIFACCLFILQTLLPYNYSYFVLIISVESYASGMCSVALLAYLSGFCKKPFVATHFALLYSLSSLSRIIISLLAGWFVDLYGWQMLFVMISILSYPVFFLLEKIEGLFIMANS